MMKAILKNDEIVKLTIDKGVEVGNISNGVSLDRLRWDGSQLVDLMNPQTLYVKYLGDGYFELHVVNLPGTQPIYMSYKERKKLRYNEENGMIFLADPEFITEEKKQEEVKLILNRLGKYLGCNQEIFIKHMAFTAALIVYASEQPQALKDFFDDIAPVIKDTFPLAKWESILKKFSKDIKVYLQAYYEKLDE